MNTRRASLTRETILIEACHLVAREGVTYLTLEKVAKEAGISKGGLLYHFPSKEALIKGMIDDMIKRSNQDIEDQIPDGENPPGEWLRAFIHTTFGEVGRKDLLSPGLVAILLANPNLVESWRDTYGQWAKNIENDNNNLMIATIVRLAVEGLWFTDLLGFSPLEGEFREKVMETLLDLTTRDNYKS
ncbi:TetR/AcrR family transcriptional regulator [Peribacillus cavernae]|uniref:TetR/AcrR family transcriptional regulator n=1 Tax=Peribacillus cavernae TaxID=1674310 RepID=UPI00163BEDEA|nr:TetR/AcrR family transcriptional regulator [Peribacillus cavernae]MDQ0217386.1 AcrR family transcriptional regulator [Peribacillus cavernae]